MQIKAKIASCHAAYSKPVKQEVNGRVILHPLVFPAKKYLFFFSNDDIDEQYEEDSIPGMGSGGGSPSAMAYLSHKLPPGANPLNPTEREGSEHLTSDMNQ